ncbi:hypothetical protein D9M69_370950 [compost metagenome]
MRHRRRARQRQPRHHRQDGRERHRRDKAEEQVAADHVRQVHGHHIAAADQLARRVAIGRVRAHHHDRAEAHHQDQHVEVADKAGGVEYGLARLPGIRHGEEAHQDMRQAGGAEHHADAQRDRIDRVGHQPARRQDRGALVMHLGRAGEHGFGAEAEVGQHHHRHEGHAAEQQQRLDDLHPGRRQHAAEHHVQHHQRADDDHRRFIAGAEQQLDQLARADHLRHQVHDDHGQRAAGGGDAHRLLRQPVRDHVGKGVAAEVAQAFGDDEQDDRPARHHAERVDQAIVALVEHHGRDAEEGRGRHHVAGDGQPVLEAGETTAGRIEIRRRTRTPRGPAGDAEREQDEQHEHHDGAPVQRPLRGLSLDRGGRRGGGGRQPAQGRAEETMYRLHASHSLRTRSLSGSRSRLARWT